MENDRLVDASEAVAGAASLLEACAMFRCRYCTQKNKRTQKNIVYYVDMHKKNRYTNA